MPRAPKSSGELRYGSSSSAMGSSGSRQPGVQGTMRGKPEKPDSVGGASGGLSNDGARMVTAAGGGTSGLHQCFSLCSIQGFLGAGPVGSMCNFSPELA